MKKLWAAVAAAGSLFAGCSSFRGGGDGGLTKFEALTGTPRSAKLSLARNVASGGIVLLENKGALPLKRGDKVALLGTAGYFCHRMGWGSGDMMAREPVQYDEGLEAAGIALDEGFAALYRAEVARQRKAGLLDRVNCDWGRWSASFAEPRLTDEAFAGLARAAGRAAKAVVVIGRGAGEAADLSDARGSFRLSREEERLIALACGAFDDVIVLLNTCGVVDTSFMDRYPVKALVYTSFLGEVSGHAVADVITGRVNPSGKTVDTWARHYYDYPTTDCFGASEVRYAEGSFVGYRHFDNRELKPRYPFGHGLSYTTFELTPRECKVDGLKASVTVTVKNTGRVAGREVVQVYHSRERRDQSIEPVKALSAFRKTRVLRPGEAVSLRLAFNLADSAAVYDEATGCWTILGGRHFILVGNSSADLKQAGAFSMAETVVAAAVGRFGRNAPSPLRRRELPYKAARETLTMDDVLANRATTRELAAQLTDEELASVVNGGVAISVDGAAGALWGSAARKIPSLVCADGPSGVRLSKFGVKAGDQPANAKEVVAWPCATALAQGWDLRAAEYFGRMVADDMVAAGVDVLLAPGLNLHRNPLCGRNFEYFSEEPLIAGLMGGAVVRGVQTKVDGSPSGRIATIKHFCTNNQESHRLEESNIVDEKTLREIYLKPFELAVREGRPKAVMSSYNLLNGVHCSVLYQLLTGVLRDEWGFDGLVMTDWSDSSDKSLHPGAGNDVIMPGDQREIDAMLAALRAGRVSRADMQASAVKVLDVVKYVLAARSAKRAPAKAKSGR